jgi:alkanesulfonate monooxygenase SsuD/methylene tetrahydromethanopterin reductase-like flavin-dependent oxidoreductase (luciferase family)
VQRGALCARQTSDGWHAAREIDDADRQTLRHDETGPPAARTVREVAARLSIRGGGPVVVGSPGTVADKLFGKGDRSLGRAKPDDVRAIPGDAAALLVDLA